MSVQLIFNNTVISVTIMYAITVLQCKVHMLINSFQVFHEKHIFLKKILTEKNIDKYQ